MRNGIINPCDGELTFIGKVIGQLPIDVHLGKLLVLSYVFGCLEECLVISECQIISKKTNSLLAKNVTGIAQLFTKTLEVVCEQTCG